MFNRNYNSNLVANGCSISGYYGENCSLPCPQHCLAGLCDSQDGACRSCIAGYTGPKCEEGLCNVFV